jgi:hypothetical protein
VRGPRVGRGCVGGDAADGDAAGGEKVVRVGGGCLRGVHGKAPAAREHPLFSVVGAVVVGGAAVFAYEVEDAAAVGVGRGAVGVEIHVCERRRREAGAAWLRKREQQGKCGGRRRRPRTPPDKA